MAEVNKEVEELKAKMAQQDETVAALAAENEKLSKTITAAGSKIKPTVDIDGVTYTVRFPRAVVFDTDAADVITKRVVTAQEIASDINLAKKLLADGFAGLVSQKNKVSAIVKKTEAKQKSKASNVVQ